MSSNKYNEYDPYNQYGQSNPYGQYNQYGQNNPNNPRKKSGKKGIVAVVIILALLVQGGIIAGVFLLIKPALNKRFQEITVATTQDGIPNPIESIPEGEGGAEEQTQPEAPDEPSLPEVPDDSAPEEVPDEPAPSKADSETADNNDTSGSADAGNGPADNVGDGPASGEQGPADKTGSTGDSGITLSDNLEDYTFEIDGKVYQLPLSYDEIVEGGFTPDTDADYMVPAGEDFYFKGDYLGNEYSTMDFAVYNNADHEVRLADIPIIYINGNQFRWNKYRDYSYKIAGGFCIENFTIKDVENKFGPTTVPEDNMIDALGTTLYYYEYEFDSGWYRFLVQPSGALAGIRICKYLK